MEYVLILGVGVSVIGGLLYFMICSEMKISPFSPRITLRERDEKRQKQSEEQKQIMREKKEQARREE